MATSKTPAGIAGRRPFDAKLRPAGGGGKSPSLPAGTPRPAGPPRHGGGGTTKTRPGGK